MATSREQSTGDTLRPILTIPGHEDWVRCIAWLSDGRVVSGSHDKTVRIWNLTNGTQEGSSMLHNDFVQGVVTTKDGRIISCGLGINHLMVWNAEIQELVNGPWLNEDYDDAWCIALSQDEELLASCHAKQIVFWDLSETMQLSHSVRYEFIGGSSFEQPTSACFSPDGQRFAVCCERRKVFVLDVETGERIFGPLQIELRVNAILWSSDGARIFCGGRLREQPVKGGQIRCLDSWTGEDVDDFRMTQQDDVRSLFPFPDGKWLASGSVDRTVCFWDAGSHEPAGKPFNFGEIILAVAFSRTGKHIACSGEGGHISVWRVPWWKSVDEQALKLLETSAIVPPDGPSNIPRISDFELLDTSASHRAHPQDHPRQKQHLPNDPHRVQTSVLSMRWWKRIPRLVHDRLHPIYMGRGLSRVYVASLDSPRSLPQQVPTNPGHDPQDPGSTPSTECASGASSDESTTSDSTN